jgi:DNA polymerase-3 subunit delta
MERLLNALDFLDQPRDDVCKIARECSVIAIHGDDDFLKRMVIDRLLEVLADGGEDEIAPYTRLDGERCEWRDVADELSTASLFGGDANIVLLESGDKFVTQHRERLEDLATSTNLRGVLLLAVKALARTTRLAKQVEKSGLSIACKIPEMGNNKPDTKRLAGWVTTRAKEVHEFSFAKGAAEELVELVGLQIGLIEQQLAKLALFAGRGGKVTTQMVIDYVGGWKTKTTWDMLDATNDGNAAEALAQLDHILQSGDSPLALQGAFSWSLRRFAAATREVERMEREGRRPNLNEALVRAGVRNYPRELEKAASHLKQIGRARAGALFEQLLQADLQLKGSHSSGDLTRWVLERTILQLSREAAPARPARSGTIPTSPTERKP